MIAYLVAGLILGFLIGELVGFFYGYLPMWRKHERFKKSTQEYTSRLSSGLTSIKKKLD